MELNTGVYRSFSVLLIVAQPFLVIQRDVDVSVMSDGSSSPQPDPSSNEYGTGESVVEMAVSTIKEIRRLPPFACEKAAEMTNNKGVLSDLFRTSWAF